MTEAIKRQERIFKKLFIFLSASLALVFLTAVFPPCDAKSGSKKESTVKLYSDWMKCDSVSSYEPAGCIFRDYLLTDRLFG